MKLYSYDVYGCGTRYPLASSPRNARNSSHKTSAQLINTAVSKEKLEAKRSKLRADVLRKEYGG